MSKPKRRNASPSTRTFLTIIPIRLFWQEREGDDPLVGILRRMSPRAVSLFAYLQTVIDMECARIPGAAVDWSRPELHGRDPMTVRLGLRELLGEIPVGGACACACACARRYQRQGQTTAARCGCVCTCEGERFALLTRETTADGGIDLFASDPYWAERCMVRGKRHTTNVGAGGWVQFRAGIIRGGPWQALTDAERKLWLFLRAVAPQQTRKAGPDFEDSGSEIVSRARLAERSRLSLRTVTTGIARLERLRLVEVERSRRGLRGRFLCNVYSAANKVIGYIKGRRVDLGFRVEEQIRGLFQGGRRARDAALAVEWWNVARRKRPPPVRLVRLI